MRDSAHDEANMSTMPKTSTPTTAIAATVGPYSRGNAAATKSVAKRICVGQRPLQSEKLLVRIAMSRSRSESMMRVATTPAALQPKPMLMVSACLPWAPERRKSSSRLKATRGR